MITYLKKTVKNTEFKVIERFEPGCWINVTNPSEDEISFLEEAFKLDKQNLISGLDKNEVPRVEFSDTEEETYIILKIITSTIKKDLDTFLITITEKFILTLSRQEPDFIKKILQGKVEFITTQKLKCLLKLFSLINKDFERSTLDVVKLVNSKRELISDLTEKDLNLLLEQEDILNRFISAYYHSNLVYERVIKNIKFFEEDKEIIEDLMIEIQQDLNLCKSSLKTISNIRDHLIISLSNKLNKVITLLTTFTLFMTIPAALSGLYGMNVILPSQENPLFFYYLISIILVLWVVIIVFLKKKKFL